MLWLQLIHISKSVPGGLIWLATSADMCSSNAVNYPCGHLNIDAIVDYREEICEGADQSVLF